jgi:hypothetical protein
LTRLSRSVPLSCVPSSAPCPGFFLSSSGSSRVEFPAFSGHMKKLRLLMSLLLRYRSRVLSITSDVSFLDSSRSASSLPVRRQTLPASRAWSLFQRSLRSALPRGEHQVSQVPRRAQCEHAPLLDPGPVRCTRFFCISLLPSTRGTVSAYGRHPLFRGSITRPVHSLCTLHVTGRPVPRNTRFQPVTNLCWTGFGPIGSR